MDNWGHCTDVAWQVSFVLEVGIWITNATRKRSVIQGCHVGVLPQSMTPMLYTWLGDSVFAGCVVQFSQMIVDSVIGFLWRCTQEAPLLLCTVYLYIILFSFVLWL